MSGLLIPGSISFYDEALFRAEILKELREKKVLLFLTFSSAGRLSLDGLISSLEKEASLIWIDRIPPNPTYKDIFRTLKLIGKEPFDAVCAIGGGSVIDMAKGAAALNYLNYDNDLSEDAVLHSIRTKEYLKSPAGQPIYAVPTTAGTGSEVTRWATVWDMEAGAKYSIEAPYLYPQKAYIVPEFTLSLSKRQTVSTALDALCQAVEAYWAKTTNPIVQELSKTAMRLITEYLPKTLNEMNVLYFRKKLALGSLFSGLAFSNTKTTACHSISYPLTMRFGIEHGLACIISLAKVMEINLPAIKEADELCKALGIRNSADMQEWLYGITKGIVDLRLSAFGIKSEDIDGLVEMSFTLGRMDNNPVLITPDDVRDILQSVL